MPRQVDDTNDAREEDRPMRTLGPLEAAVMESLWDAGAALSVRQVAERLADRDLAYTTVATVLQNLHRKAWVSRERIGRVWFYRALVGPDEHAALVMRDALATGSSPRATFLRFVDEISDEEAALLRELLTESEPYEQPRTDRNQR